MASTSTSHVIPRIVQKRGFHRVEHKIGLPYPNYGIGPDELPILCRCFMADHSFYVNHEQDMPTLYRNGGFGQSNLTKRGPSSLLEHNYENQYYYKKHKEKMEKIQNGETENTTETEANETERLILLPEEVIFLSFGVGCLSIQKESTLEYLNFNKVWKILVEQNPDFPYMYAVYHYLRSKNWVPKPGNDLGGDYVIYRVGPDFYHATFVVRIVGLPSRRRISWLELHATQRVAVTVSKNVLLCEVKIPENFNATESTPRSIFDIKIQDTFIKRWLPFGRSGS